MKNFPLLFFVLSTICMYSQTISSIDYTRISNKINKNRLELESEIVGETTLPMLYKFKNEKLILNGSGLKKHHYACGLYLEIPKTEARSIIDADEFMIIRLDILDKKSIPNDKIVKEINKAFKGANRSYTINQLKNEIELFMESMEGLTVQNGDKVDIVYEPLNGVSLYVNYNKKFTIKSLEFKKAIFNIWLSEEASDKKLKKELLNGAKEYF